MRFTTGANLLAIAVLMLPHVGLATDGLEPIGVSMQARARGGADIAVGDSALSQIDNPGTLTLLPRYLYQFDTAAKITIVDSLWKGPIDSANAEQRLIPLTNAGLSIPVNDRLTVGTALHVTCGLGTRYHIRHLMLPFTDQGVGSDTKVVGLSINAGYKLTDKLSLGIGGRAQTATSKSNIVLGPVDVKFGRGQAYGGGFQLGLHYQARDDLSFGLGYRSPTWFNDLGGGDAEASVFGRLPLSLGKVAFEEFRLPQKITVGAAWDPTPRVKLVGEVRWLNYANSTFHSTTVATDGLIDLRYPLPLGYRDQWAFITGAEFKLKERWKLGVGYHYATPVVPASNLLPIGSTIAQHHATVGLRYEARRWWAGAGYVIALPASLHGPGYSDIPFGVDYGMSTIRQTQHCISFGFGFRW